MDEVVFDKSDGVEYDPLYNEILFMLAENDDASDPLNIISQSLPISWNFIQEKATYLLTACIDLRVAMWLMRSELHTLGIAALYKTIKLIDDALVKNPDDVYPHIHDEPAGSGHAAALGWLSTPQCLSEIKAARLLANSELTLEHIVLFGAERKDGQPSFPEMIMMLEKSCQYYLSQSLPPLAEQLQYCVDGLERIENYANKKANLGDGYRLDCRHIIVFLGQVLKKIGALNYQRATPEDKASDEELSVMPITVTSKTSLSSAGNITCRQDAILMLNSVIEYFNRHEPGHPAPIFIKRTQKMIGMDFESIVQELIPEALDTLQQYIGK